VLKVSGALFSSSIGHDDVPHRQKLAAPIRDERGNPREATGLGLTSAAVWFLA
jgi:hypothetical protein